MTVRRVIPFVLLLATAACSSQPAPPGESATTSANAGAGARTASSPATPAESAPVKPVPADLPDVLARVNGEDIGRAEFEQALRNLEMRAGGSVPDSERARIYRGVLDELIGYRLLLQESRSRKVTVPESDVEARMGEVLKQFPTPDAFKQMLAERKLTERDIRNEMRNEMVVGRLLESEIEPRIFVAEGEISEFYARNPKQFATPEQVRASHILISVQAGATAEAKAAALAKATDILENAKGGADFAALAREHSQDPGSAASGGDLGFFQQGQMVGPFNDVAFRLAKGQVSDVVETEFGYHIIKVVDRQPGRSVPLAEARPRIEEYLESVNRQKETQAFVQVLRSKGKIEVFI